MVDHRWHGDLSNSLQEESSTTLFGGREADNSRRILTRKDVGNLSGATVPDQGHLLNPNLNQQNKIKYAAPQGHYDIEGIECDTPNVVVLSVLGHRIPEFAAHQVAQMFLSTDMRGRASACTHLLRMAELPVRICIKHDVFNRTAELAQMYGIQFFDVLSRGSQF
eukprot:gene15714-4734_t